MTSYSYHDASGFVQKAALERPVVIAGVVSVHVDAEFQKVHVLSMINISEVSWSDDEV